MAEGTVSGSRERSDREAPRWDAASAATCTLTVEGLDCSSCAESVDKAIRSLSGVRDVATDVLGQRVTVTYAEGELGRAELVGAVERIGYRVRAAPAVREVFEVPEMDCAQEVNLIEGKLGGLPGVARLGFDIVGRRLTVEGDVTAAEVERALAQLGMRARLVGEARSVASWWERRGRLALAVLAGVLWVGALVSNHLLRSEPLAAAMAIAAMLAAGRYIVPRGVRAALNGALDMNFLMSIAALGALFIGEYEEAATAMFLFAVAQLLESYSMDRARNAIKGLMDLSPAVATVLRGGEEVRVPVDRVEVGEIVLVRPGEKVSVDGQVVSGSSSVNQAPITGESVPIEKEAGAEVFAGTLNGDGVLEVRSSRLASDTTLARIIHSVEEAQAARAPSQTLVDRFARVYTPGVVVAAVLLATLPPLAGFGAWGEWFYRALVLLVVACPCALVISTPVTIVSALAGAARKGILIKGGLHLENAGRARVVALDKTGTLTEGEPAVVEIVAFDARDADEVLTLAASVESRSEHALARAVLRHASHRGVRTMPATGTRALPGRGIRGRVGDTVVLLGNERLFTELGALPEAARRALAEHEARGRTAVLVGTRPAAAPEDAPLRVVGAIVMADRLRPQAAAALEALHRAGIEHVAMLTGDNAGTAGAVAEALGGAGLGIDEYRAGLLPDDKVAAVRELARRHGTLVFVGDGVNDAPALAAADVGVAMGTAGTDVALETADIALMTDDLSRLPTTIRIARKAERIIRANIAFALLTKAIFVALAVLGYATLWMAVLADTGASLIVVLNGLRALRE